jgi:hypothetical protein
MKRWPEVTLEVKEIDVDLKNSGEGRGKNPWIL